MSIIDFKRYLAKQIEKYIKNGEQMLNEHAKERAMPGVHREAVFPLHRGQDGDARGPSGDSQDIG